MLALQSALVIGLFEFVRRRIPATATNADNESGAFGFAESVPSIESAEERFHAIEAAIRGLTNRDANKNQDAKIEQLRSFAMSAHTDLKKVLAIAEAVCASSVSESVIQTTRKVPIPFSDADEDKIQNFITACEFALIGLGRNDAYRNLMKKRRNRRRHGVRGRATAGFHPDIPKAGNREAAGASIVGIFHLSEARHR